MTYAVGDRVLVNMRSLSPDYIPRSPRAELPGTVIESPLPGLYNVRLDATIDGLDTLMDLGADRLLPYTPDRDDAAREL